MRWNIPLSTVLLHIYFPPLAVKHTICIPLKNRLVSKVSTKHVQPYFIAASSTNTFIFIYLATTINTYIIYNFTHQQNYIHNLFCRYKINTRYSSEIMLYLEMIKNKTKKYPFSTSLSISLQLKRTHSSLQSFCIILY